MCRRPRLQRAGVVDVHDRSGIGLVPGYRRGGVGLAGIHQAAAGGDSFRGQPAQFFELSRVDPYGVFHDPPVVRPDAGFLHKVSVTRGDGLGAGVTKIIFGTDRKHGPVVEPLQFVVLEQLAKLVVEFFRVVTPVVPLPHLVIEIFVALHFLRLFFDPGIPILLFRRFPVVSFHVKSHIGMIRIVLVSVVVEYDVVHRLEVHAICESLRLGVLLVATQIAFSLAFSCFEWEASGIGRSDWLQSTFFSYLVFFPSPSADNLIEERIRRNIVESFYKDRNGRHLIVDTGFFGRNAVKVMELNFCVVSFPVLGVLGGRVDVGVTEMPPLTETFGKVDASKTTTSSWFAALQANSIRYPIEIFTKIVVYVDRL
mmetsp:Transcript_18419/g.42302  ORF Transcript_18419/g.42302 Transcript_18419/m.42302 type:complete len:369 (-) Transcript_18419:639-1745(-)